VRPELAVFGGSFDPPHVGHVFLATYALSIAGVARVLVAPTFEHAFGKQMSAFEHRLAMCELAFAALPAAQVSPIERELGGTSRTLRLVHALAARYPDYQLRLLIGSDILAQADRWQGFDEISRIAPPLVAARGGHGGAAGPVLPELSSSELREGIRQGTPDRLVLPHGVLDYITQHQLYRNA
jgi:nicotinate-nucleotide adenylyltransferase